VDLKVLRVEVEQELKVKLDQLDLKVKLDLRETQVFKVELDLKV
jgi:hypothetical protein